MLDYLAFGEVANRKEMKQFEVYKVYKADSFQDWIIQRK